MPAEALCPQCQLKLRVPANYAGRSVKCPQCQHRFPVMLPGSAPTAAPPPAATKQPPGFDQLILALLDDEKERTAAPGAVTVDGPSKFWRCPKCQSLSEKKSLPVTTLQSTRIQAMVRCKSCGDTVSYIDLHAGKYDAAEVTLDCPHCKMQFCGPAADLLGKPCPGCNRPLPRG